MFKLAYLFDLEVTVKTYWPISGMLMSSIHTSARSQVVVQRETRCTSARVFSYSIHARLLTVVIEEAFVNF